MVITGLLIACLWLKEIPAPILTVEGDFSLPAEILDVPEIREQLDSGLTLTLLVSWRNPKASRDPIRYRFDLRFDPWDETYSSVVFPANLEREEVTLKSLEELRLWWKTPRFKLPQGGSESIEGVWKVEIEVIPFSAEEQDRARRWVAASQSSQPGGGLSRSTDASNVVRDEPRGGILQSIMASSIQRDAILMFRWRIESIEGTQKDTHQDPKRSQK
jgi:hypothetical protein